MKKLTILGIIISLFAFCDNKKEITNAYAEEVTPVVGTSATFGKVSGIGDYLSSNQLKDYYKNIVSIKISNDTNDLPSDSSLVCSRIKVKNCTYTDINGNETMPEEGVIFAYVSKASDSTTDNLRYDCVLYANADKIYAPVDAYRMLGGFPAVEQIDLAILDTSKTTNMSNFFSSNSKLKSLDLSNFDTSKVTNMDYMFNFCGELTEINISSFNTSNVTTMHNMFASCYVLKKLDLSNFDTSNVIDMASLFNFCTGLTELTMNFDTSKVTKVGDMFYKCESLKVLDLSSWDMSKVENFDGYYFMSQCSNIEYFKLPKQLPEGKTLYLPYKLEQYYGIETITSETLSQHKEFNIPGDDFVEKWASLRAEGGENGICAALSSGSAGNAKLTQILAEYDAFDNDYKEYINKATDIEGVTIGESIQYIKNVLNGTQTTDGDYGITKEDAGSFVTSNVIEDSSYLIIIISLLGVLAVLAYYFYNKKKHAN